MIVLDPITITDAILNSSNVAENDYDAYSATGVWGPGERVIDNHLIYQQLLGEASAVTLTIASPCVVSKIGHGYSANQPLKLTTTGALPTGLTAGTTYYLKTVDANTFQLSATPGGAAINTTGSQSGVHTLTKNDIGKTPADYPLYWQVVNATNRWKMFDSANNTQTENLDSIEVELEPGQIINGLYIGGIDGTDVEVTFTDPVEGVVYSNTTDLVLPTTGLSYWNWCFSRIRRRNFLIDLNIPPYLDGVLEVAVNNSGGTAKVAFLGIGPTMTMGFTEYGVGREEKDYSTTRFDIDGTSSTTVRPYAKKLSIDVVVYNEDIDVVIDELANYRQRNVVWIGAVEYGHTVAYGKYVSFKNVIADYPSSRMALNIEGAI